MSRDVFRPRNGPAAVIYDAICEALRALKDSDPYGGIEAAEAAYHRTVHEAANNAIEGFGTVTLEQVQSAERSAMGHTDYVKQFTYGIIRSAQPS